jgi:hypothetical protein
MSDRRRRYRAVIRYSPFLRGFIGLAGVAFVWASIALLLAEGITVLSVGGIACALVGLAGMAETLLGRVELGPDRLSIVGPLSRREYPRSDIESVKWLKHRGLFLLFRNGKPVEVPWVGPIFGNVGPEIRAWLKDA